MKITPTHIIQLIIGIIFIYIGLDLLIFADQSLIYQYLTQ